MSFQAALRAYRRNSLEEAPMDDRVSTMFVLCAECGAANQLVAACQPAVIFQAFGGLRDPEEPAARATLEYAIEKQGVRQVLVCGHHGCGAVGDPSARATRAAVVAQCRALRESKGLGPLLRTHRVVVRPLWFDEAEGDVFLCNYEDDTVALLDDPGFERLWSDVVRRTA